MINDLQNYLTLEKSESRKEEIWCNSFSTEVLVPLDMLRNEARSETQTSDIKRLVRTFHVSPFVILRRLYEVKLIYREKFDRLWKEQCSRAEPTESNNFL